MKSNLLGHQKTQRNVVHRACDVPDRDDWNSRKECIARLILVCLIGGMVSPAQADWYHDEQAIMGTSVSLTLWSDDNTTAKRAIALVMGEMRRIDATLSTYNPASLVSKVNRDAATGNVDITPELLTILDKSLYYSGLSQGAFDISYASVGKHYDYRLKQQPALGLRKQLLSAIGYHKIHLDKVTYQVAFAHPQLQIGLGGIAKGYAVDRGIAILADLGITSASISAGGDSRVLGDKRGKPWLVGIKNPRGRPGDGVAIVVPLTNTAISTSGDYERFFFDDQTDERIHHILNPKTGQSSSGIASVSVIGPNGFDTDPLSTTVFVLGIDSGLALINNLDGFDGVIIDSHGVVHYSEGLEPPITQIDITAR
ncbi:MAG: thiamine biosynthesis lipoprotein [Candidatus Azotimanducaceae bacterium]|jgi:thiamine biosynthesis lipoprotein